ncbi:MAG: serine hydrolase family protein [Candidatus Harrisonbacteria bacterium]|nr:serine hydrolase family protein [Candidatus Harrisonbacteria bacterium]
MPKRIFIIHGWQGYPEEGWFPWLKRELEARGFVVTAPALPDTDHPRIHKWIPAIAKAVGTPDAETFFIGHSMGCQAIARYLETLPAGVAVGGAVFVAGYFKRLTGLGEEPEFAQTEKHWLGAPIDFAKIKTHLPKSIAIFSDNDPYVPLDDQDDFRDKLGATIIVEHAMGHFSGDSGTTELPIALKSILEMAGVVE